MRGHPNYGPGEPVIPAEKSGQKEIISVWFMERDISMESDVEYREAEG